MNLVMVLRFDGCEQRLQRITIAGKGKLADTRRAGGLPGSLSRLQWRG
jgi:hypothetical protein